MEIPLNILEKAYKKWISYYKIGSRPDSIIVEYNKTLFRYWWDNGHRFNFHKREELELEKKERLRQVADQEKWERKQLKELKKKYE